MNFTIETEPTTPLWVSSNHTVEPMDEALEAELSQAAAAFLLLSHGGSHPNWTDRRSPLSVITRIVIDRRMAGDPSLDDWYQSILLRAGYGVPA